MLKSHESPKNGDYASYIDELVKQSSLSSPAQNPNNDFTQDFPESFTSNEGLTPAVPAKPAPYSLPPQEKPTDTNQPPVYTASAFNKNVRRFFFLIFLLVFLGSIIAESDGQGAIVLIIIVVIAMNRSTAMATMIIRTIAPCPSDSAMMEPRNAIRKIRKKNLLMFLLKAEAV